MTSFPANTSYPIQKVIPVDLNGDYAPFTGVGVGSTAPGAPAQVATASGANLAQAVVSVTGSTLVSPASTVARVVSLALPPTATDGVQLSFVNPAVAGVGVFTLLPGGIYETPVPITKPIYAIALSGTQIVTRVEFL